VISKPEGYELRDRRSDRSCSAADWLPADALYSAWQKLQTTEPGAAPACLFVAWKDESGEALWRAAGTVEQIDSLLLRATMNRSSK
jgi:hypothetical protein